MFMNDLVTYESIENVAVITINRPEKLNALNPAVVEGLREVWARYETSDTTPLDLWMGVPDLGVPVTKPIIAAVHGHVIGGAFILIMHCDLIIAAESTVFHYPEARVGFTGGLVAGLVVRIPQKVAVEFMLLGQPMTAQRAYEVGMVNKIVPVGTQMEAAKEWAKILVNNAPLVVSTLKAFSLRTIPKSPSDLAAEARRDLTRIHTSRDRTEGERAFAEKRVPKYRGT
ncbi:MAG: enoyl-CoA hydratase [Acidobacteria bacterium]|nr:MAG: enoyl-CoA hydratase [Acidobacteriota bacterium]